MRRIDADYVRCLKALIALGKVEFKDMISAREMKEVGSRLKARLLGECRPVRRVVSACVGYPESFTNVVKMTHETKVLCLVICVADAPYTASKLSPFFPVLALDGQKVCNCNKLGRDQQNTEQ